MADQLPSVQQGKLKEVRHLLEAMKPQMLMVLNDPRHVETMTRVALTSIQRNPALLFCDQRSLMGAIMQSCQLGLEPDDVRGLAYLIPFGNKVTLVPGYGGILFLALQTEGVQDIYARLVHAGDEFEVDYGSDWIIHKPVWPGTKGYNGDVIAGYYVIVYDTGYRRFGGGKDGGVMWRPELDEIKAAALANKKDPANADLPWNARWEQMAWKTLIRRAGKGLPKNSRLATAIRLDEQAEQQIPQNLELLVDPETVAEAEKKAAEKPTAPRKQKGAVTQTVESESVKQAATEPEAKQPDPPQASHSGSLFGSGAPDDRLTAQTLEEVVAKMSRWDKEHGSKVADAAMKDRYKVTTVTNLTEAQAREWIESINASLGLPAGE